MKERTCKKTAIICLVALLLSMTLMTGCQASKTIDSTAEIMKMLNKKDIIPEDWHYLDSYFPVDGGEWRTYKTMYLCFIDEDLYDTYKYLWMEDVDQSEIGPGYSPEEVKEVFHIVKVLVEDDGSYELQFYMNGTYYLYFWGSDIKNESSYDRDSAEVYMDCRDDSLVAVLTVKKNMFGKWQIETVQGNESLSDETGTQMNLEELRSVLNDKSWTANDEDINPEGTTEKVHEVFQERGYIPEEWEYVGNTDFRGITFFYIDKDKYETYKHYWLEGVDPSELGVGYNENLFGEGEYVFHGVRINRLRNGYDWEECGMNLQADVTYYRVMLYQKMLYFKYFAEHYPLEAPKEFTAETAYTQAFESLEDENNVLAVYYCHYEDGQLVIEEAPATTSSVF